MGVITQKRSGMNSMDLFVQKLTKMHLQQYNQTFLYLDKSPGVMIQTFIYSSKTLQNLNSLFVIFFLKWHLKLNCICQNAIKCSFPLMKM